MNILSIFGLVYLLGTGFITLGLLLLSWIGVPIDRVSVSSLVTIVLLLIWIFRRKIFKKKKSITTWILAEYALASLVSLLLLIVLVNGLWNVVSVWDALTLYDFRALRIVETGSLRIAAEIQGPYFFSYPLYTSLAHVALYVFGLKSPMIFYSFFFISFISVCYGLLRRTKTRLIALLASFLLIIAPHLFWHAQIAYTNLPYTAFLGLGAIYILEYSRTGKRSDAVLGAVLTGLSIWVRSVEPFWIVNMVILLAITLYKKRFVDSFLSLITFIPLERVWKVYIATAQKAVASNPLAEVASAVTTVATTVVGTVSPTPKRLPIEVINYFIANAVRPFTPVLALFALGIMYKLSIKSKNWLGELMIGGYYIVAFYGTYIFSISQPYWNNIPGSLERMMMFVSPIILYIFTINLNNFNEKK